LKLKEKNIMPFVQRHEEIIKKLKPYSYGRLWLNAFVFSIFIFIINSLYLFLRRGDYDLFIANKALATSSLMLIGFSLALSGLCYFWDFVDTKIIYRKHLGLIGFFLAGAHVIVSGFFLSNKFTAAWFESKKISMLFGGLALLVFLAMAAISNRYLIHELGGKYWRAFMRFGGYLAFIFIILHFSLLKYPEWLKWLSTGKPFLPPLSLIGVIFGLAVIVLRLALWLAVKRTDRK